MEKPQKTPPAYAIASVDHALRLATILQLEGNLTVAEAAERLGVARSTAHRLLQMLVYRDFAVQHPGRQYGAGPSWNWPNTRAPRPRCCDRPRCHTWNSWSRRSESLPI